MKKRMNGRVWGLCVLLAIVVVGGGMLLWKLQKPQEKENTKQIDNKAEYAGIIQEGEIYVETQLLERDISLPADYIIEFEGRHLMLQTREQEMELVDVATEEVVWQVIPYLKNWMNTNDIVTRLAFDTDGFLYCVYSESNGSDQIKVAKLKEGQMKPEEIILLEGLEEADATKFLVDDEYFYVYGKTGDSGLGNLKIFHRDGKLYQTIQEVNDFVLDGEGSIYILHCDMLGNGSVVKKYKTATMEEVEEFSGTIPQGSGKTLCIALEKGSGILYLGSNINIQMLDATSGGWIGTAMNIADSAPGLQDTTLVSMAVDRQQNIYCYAMNDNEWKGMLFQYSIEKDTQGEQLDTLTVTAPYRDDYFINVITKFEKEHPGQKVKYDYVYNSRQDFLNNSDADGYFERMNMRLLAGDVGDIVIFESRSWDIYHTFDKDLFLDLTERLEQSPIYEELYGELMNGLTVQDALQGVPLSVDYCYMQVNESLCDELGIEMDWSKVTWSDVLKLEKQLHGTDKYLFSMVQNSERAFFRMLISNMPDLIDLDNQKMDLQQNWFLQLIEEWKVASSGKNFAKFTQRAGLTEDALLCIDWRTSDMPYAEYTINQAEKFEEDTGMKMGYAPLPQGEKASNYNAYSTQIYAIHTETQNEDMAWKLIETALSAELQTSNSLNCCPVNKKASENKKEQQREAMVRSLREDFLPEQEELFDELDVIYRSVDYLYDMYHLKEDLAYPLLSYLNHSTTLEEALEQAEHDIWIRINE